jgi:crotonobetainyl-CoA:carnitine CoA-transferase CaiB-like acyl-CoA transferase
MDNSASVLQGLTVTDFGLGMPAALVCKFLREAGAKIRRLEPPQGDPFYDVYPAYRVWQQHKDMIPPGAGTDSASDLVADADICVIGGEDYPGLSWKFDPQELVNANPRLILINIEAAPEVDGEPPLRANELLAQARSGFSFENFSDRPIAFNFPVASYGAILNALVGVFAALVHREQTGKGQVVSTSLVEGALDACRSTWFTAENPDPLFMAKVPKDSRMTIFRCADGKYVHLMMGTPGAKDRFHNLLGMKPGEFTDTLTDRGMPTGMGDPSQFWGDIDAYAKPIAQYTSDEFIALLVENELPCGLVEKPGDCWDNPQVAANGILETDDEGRQYVGFPIKGL